MIPINPAAPNDCANVFVNARYALPQAEAIIAA